MDATSSSLSKIGARSMFPHSEDRMEIIIGVGTRPQCVYMCVCLCDEREETQTPQSGTRNYCTCTGRRKLSQS